MLDPRWTPDDAIRAPGHDLAPRPARRFDMPDSLTTARAERARFYRALLGRLTGRGGGTTRGKAAVRQAAAAQAGTAFRRAPAPSHAAAPVPAADGRQDRTAKPPCRERTRVHANGWAL